MLKRYLDILIGLTAVVLLVAFVDYISRTEYTSTKPVPCERFEATLAK